MEVHSFWMSFLIRVYTLYSHTVCKANAPISPKKVNALNPMNRRLFLSAKNSVIFLAGKDTIIFGSGKQNPSLT